ERKIDKVKIAGELEAGEAPDVVCPMRRVHKILALLCHARGFNLHRQKRFDLRLGLRIQPLKRDIRYHHVTAGSPSKRWLRAGQQQDCEACDRDYFDARAPGFLFHNSSTEFSGSMLQGAMRCPSV